MNDKSFTFKLKEVGDAGEFSGYASVFDVVDLQGERVKGSAFKRTLDHSGGRIPILWNHDPAEPIGVSTSMREDSHGLHIDGKLNLETQRGREAHSLLKQGALKGLSIGYDVVKDTIMDGVRDLVELKLWETSIVTFPANVQAGVSTIKTSISSNLPLAERSKPWSKASALKRVKAWAGAEDGPNAKYRRAFLWYDKADGENFGAYKLPIGDVVDGELKAVPRAVFAAAAALQGARGGVDIPDSDKSKIRSNLTRYYDKLDMSPPWTSAWGGDLENVQMTPNESKTLKEARDVLDALLARTGNDDSGSTHSDESTLAKEPGAEAKDTSENSLADLMQEMRNDAASRQR